VSERAEDVFILFAVRAQLNPVLLGNDQRDLEDVDRVQTQTLPVEGRDWIDLGGGDVEIQSLDNEIRDFSL
jgi:hypothetical protein